MKMTQLFWRIVSVWLCVAVVCRCYVGCTESHPEPQGPKSSEGVSSEKETEENTDHQQNEESSALSAQSLSENEQLTKDDRPKVGQITQDVEKKQHSEAFEAEEPAEDVELETDRVSQLEGSSQYQHPKTSISQDQKSAPSQLSPDSAFVHSAANKDNPSVLNLQEEVPDSISSDAPDADTAEALASDLPPADCVEEEANPYDGDSPPLVLENTSNAHTIGTKTHPDPPLSPPAVHGTKYLEANTSHMLKEQDLSSPVAADADPSATTKDPEDIPTFDEWKRKVMEVEKERTLTTHTSSNGGSNTVKKVQKNFNNYASVECGAKILGANPEAKSTSAILKENMDLYMLNPCSNKIWFIIELCEPIQVKQLDIANFELFSSTPKDFLVSISDRYPTNKWLKLGTFHARDERTLQSFPLDEHLYAKYVKMFTKYIKVELVSHFGTEHFCPLSLIRVFGTSMVEEYEIADPPERPDDQEDDLDYPSGTAPGEVKSSKNLIGSAKDAILNIVNVAVNALGGNSEMNGNFSSQEHYMTEPSQQLETTSETGTTDLPSDPDSEKVPVSPETAVPPTEAPPSDIPSPETPTTDDSEQQLPPVEEKIVIPLEKDEEEPISSTITLLGKDEELDEDKEKKVHQERQQENLKYCPLLASLSSPCSCAPSLQEHVQQQCSASLSKRRKCQTMYTKPNISPIQTPTWLLPPPPSACPEPQSDGGEEKEQTSEPEPESEVVLQVSQPAGNSEESISEPVLLEPSQTVNLPKPSATESSVTSLTEETPQLSSEEPDPEKSHDVLAEEKHIEPSATLSSSPYDKPSSSSSVSVEEASEEPTEEKPDVDDPQPEVSTPAQIQDKTDQSLLLLPTSSYLEHQAGPPAEPESGSTPPEASQPAPDTVAESEPPAAATDTKTEHFSEDLSASSGISGHLLLPSSLTPSTPTSSSLLDIYAEPFNVTEQNGNQVHGTSQKESVFMRLNNRIKALEVNMSLSGRYLEQLSQRYRKQMEEMQRAFNRTIIKLQNTSRIAEEQDLRQTESIQLLQGQLENVTQLVLNLSARVSQLQNEVSDRQNYLLLSLGLCLCLGLLLCVNHRRIAVPPTTEPEPPTPKSYTYCCPERQFSCDETGLKRSASYPLIHSDSFQFATTEGPELHEEETQSHCAASRKRRRRKAKPTDKVETLKASFHAAPELCNGAVCNGVAGTANATLLTKQLLQPAFRHSPSEGSSEGSSHSDDPSFCGITAACSRICDGLPPPKTRAEKRALRRRRPKPGSTVVDLLRAPRRDNIEPLPITIQDFLQRKTEKNSGTFVALTRPV